MKLKFNISDQLVIWAKSSILALCSIMLIFILFQSCKTEKVSFNEWYAQNYPTKEGSYDSTKMRTVEVVSDVFHIDTIYRSMMGPIYDSIFSIEKKGSLIWLVGYEIDIVSEEGSVLSGADFMCHNNFFLNNSELPWDEGRFRNSKRVFTMTPGYVSQFFPKGFGVPLPSEQSFKVVFQALNHNLNVIDTNIKHKVRLSYFLEDEIDFPLKKLEMQGVYIMKKFEGPPGRYDEEIPSDWQPDQPNNIGIYHDAQQPTCGVEMLANNPNASFDQFADKFGRKFTGHWKIPPGKEKESVDFNLPYMRYFEEDVKLYYASAHAHPFCKFLEIYDKTDQKSILKLNFQNFTDKIGVNEIEYFSSIEGVQLYKNHEYTLISEYENTSNDTLSAMSAIYLYLN